MPRIEIDIHRKGFERMSDFTFEPGDPAVEIKVDGREVMKEWVHDENPIGEGGNDPGLTMGQANTINLLTTRGLKLNITEDGTIEVTT